MSEKILCVDDDPKILEAFQRALRKQFRMEMATSGAEGLSKMDIEGPFAVVVSDMRMPGMDGAVFLAKARVRAPHTVRIMLTGNSDLHTAIDAVNDGHIFRFLTKPCSPEILSKALGAGIEQYRLVMAQTKLLEETLLGVVRTLTDVLSLSNPTAFSRSLRVQRFCRQIADQLGAQDPWQVEIAGMLSQLGCMAVPEEVLNRIYTSEPISAEEFRMYQNHPLVGSDLLAHIPRMEAIAEIIAYQEKLYDGSGFPHDERKGVDIPLGARILKVALDFDRLLSRGTTLAEAYQELCGREGWYDTIVVQALNKMIGGKTSYELRCIRVKELSRGLILAEDIVSVRGLTLIAKGQEITPILRHRLESFLEQEIIGECVKVLVPSTAVEQVGT